MKNSQLNRKLDYKKIDLFIIKEKKSRINYELELLDGIKIYPVFHVLLLEFADPRILILIKILLGLVLGNKYEVERITGYDSKTQRYVIKWKEYLMKKNL